METKIIKDPLSRNKIKLVWGTPREAAMVDRSTGDPTKSAVEVCADTKYGGLFRITHDGRDDPDNVKYMFWINSSREGDIQPDLCSRNLCSRLRGE